MLTLNRSRVLLATAGVALAAGLSTPAFADDTAADLSFARSARHHRVMLPRPRPVVAVQPAPVRYAWLDQYQYRPVTHYTPLFLGVGF